MGLTAGHHVRRCQASGDKLTWAGTTRSPKEWASFVDVSVALYCALLVCASIIEFLLEQMETKALHPQCGVILQLLCPALQLSILVGMTQDKCQSRTSKFCTSPSLIFLGKISMALYLIHMPLHLCLMIALRGPMPLPGDGTRNYCETKPVTLECHEMWKKYFQLPPWGIFVVSIASLIMAFLLERYFETPMRNLLRTGKTHSKTSSKSMVMALKATTNAA